MQADISGPSAEAGWVLWNRVCPSFHPSVRPSRHFLGIGLFCFFLILVVVRNPYELVWAEPDFVEKVVLLEKWWKLAQNIFFEFVEKFWLLIFSEFGL